MYFLAQMYEICRIMLTVAVISGNKNASGLSYPSFNGGTITPVKRMANNPDAFQFIKYFSGIIGRTIIDNDDLV